MKAVNHGLDVIESDKGIYDKQMVPWKLELDSDDVGKIFIDQFGGRWRILDGNSCFLAKPSSEPYTFGVTPLVAVFNKKGQYFDGLCFTILQGIA